MMKNFFVLVLFCIATVYSTPFDFSSNDLLTVLNDQRAFYGTFEKIVPMPDQGGSFINDVYLITTSKGEELVLKAENPQWTTRKTLNEVSALFYIEKNTEIPVPHVIKYHNEIATSPLGIEYILMNRMQGKALNLVIEEIYTNKPLYVKILKDLADIIARLHSIQFEYMGNVENYDNKLTIVSPIEFPQSVISNPCHKFSAYAFAWLLHYTNEIKRLKNANHYNQKQFSRLIPRLEHMLNTTDFSILDDPKDLFVYCHQDFVMKNILIDNNGVSAILDWEWSGPALPEFEVATGFDFLRSQEDRTLFEKLMAERGVPHFFNPPPLKRQLFYELIGHLYALISCYEWTEGKLEHSAKFLAQKLEQRVVKKEKHFNMEKFVNDKTEIIEKILENFELLQEELEAIADMLPSSNTYTEMNSKVGLGAKPTFEFISAYRKPIAFFGLSGVGKTTLAHGLVELAPDLFSLIPITTSRLPRSDDDLRYMEFLSEFDFISNRDEGHFALSWQQDGNYYGYRRSHLENMQKHPLITCSLSAIQILKDYGAITVLIKGDGIKGLESRGSDEITKQRVLLNIKNREKYLNQPWFKENIDLEYDQIWGNILHSTQNLYNSIMDILE